MKRYRSHKIVEAAQIDGWFAPGSATPSGGVIVAGEDILAPPGFFARGNPHPGDYLVRYEDGYLSWSPKKAFEEGYTLVEPESVLEQKMEKLRNFIVCNAPDFEVENLQDIVNALAGWPKLRREMLRNQQDDAPDLDSLRASAPKEKA